jgi:hypothetical protein
MTEAKTSLDAEALELLKLNHQSLHEAYWSCHRIYWTVTSIFLPVVFAAMGVIFVELPSAEPVKVAIALLLVFAFVTFWFLSSRLLYAWNATRRVRLKTLEDEINALEIARPLKGNKLFFAVYKLQYGENRRWYLPGFQTLSTSFYVLLLVVCVGIGLAKAFSW